MPQGIEVYNDTTSLLINSEFRNYTLRRSGVLNPGNFISYPVYLWDSSRAAILDTSGTNRPVVVLRPLNRASRATVFQTRLGISGVLDNADRMYVFVNSGETITAMEWFMFDDWQHPGSGNVGLQTFNATGQKVFDSEWPLLNIISAHTMPKFSIQQIYADANMARFDYLVANAPVGPKVGFLCAPTGLLLLQPNVFTSSTLFGEFLYFSGQSLRGGFGFLYEDDPPERTFPIYRDYIGPRDNKAFIVDVTNLPVGVNYG